MHGARGGEHSYVLAGEGGERAARSWPAAAGAGGEASGNPCAHAHASRTLVGLAVRVDEVRPPQLPGGGREDKRNLGPVLEARRVLLLGGAPAALHVIVLARPLRPFALLGLLHPPARLLLLLHPQGAEWSSPHHR